MLNPTDASGPPAPDEDPDAEPDKPKLDTARPFRRADAKAARLALRQLRGPRFRTIFRGVYIDATVPDSPTVRAEAAVSLFDRTAWASHATAARVYGLPIPALPGEHVTVVDAPRREGPQGIRVHTAQRPGVVRKVEGVMVSDYCQLFVELAGLLTLVDLVVVGDAMVRKKWVTVEALKSFCAASSDRHVRAARTAASYVRKRVDSPMETRLRMLLVLAGLPEPMVNITIEDEFGLPLRRYDLSWPEIKLIVEYDGRHHAEREEQWTSDLGRREAIDDDGWRILVIVADGIYKNPGQTVEKVHALLVARRLPGVPRVPGDGWRPHFPGRT